MHSGVVWAPVDDVVNNDVVASLPDPAGFIFSATVLQVEHRVTLLRLRIVVRRKVDERMAPRAGDLRVVPDVAHLAVGHVLNGVVSRTRLGDFNHAGVAGAAKEGFAAGI